MLLYIQWQRKINNNNNNNNNNSNNNDNNNDNKNKFSLPLNIVYKDGILKLYCFLG